MHHVSLTTVSHSTATVQTSKSAFSISWLSELEDIEHRDNVTGFALEPILALVLVHPINLSSIDAQTANSVSPCSAAANNYSCVSLKPSVFNQLFTELKIGEHFRNAVHAFYPDAPETHPTLCHTTTKYTTLLHKKIVIFVTRCYYASMILCHFSNVESPDQGSDFDEETYPQVASYLMTLETTLAAATPTDEPLMVPKQNTNTHVKHG